LGANVIKVGSSDPLFLTNSHCTKRFFGLDAAGSDATWYQPLALDSIASRDRTDPSLFSGGSCPAGRVCRWSDAALVTYFNSADWGGALIAYPTQSSYPFEFVLAIVISQSTPPPIGNGVYKVGIATGMSFGQLGQTCVNYNLVSSSYLDPPPTNTTLLCQNNATGLSHAFGDSGGPVFRWAGFIPETAIMLGIHWGGVDQTTVYSPVSGIKKDLGTLKYDLQ
jgi:hypothetical protein